MKNTEGYCISDIEELFFKELQKTFDVKTVFDVGCRNDTAFTSFEGVVHYFDPVKDFIDDLKTQPNVNTSSFFNNFGLSTENKDLFYYPKYQSFHDRFVSCGTSDDKNKFVLSVRKASDYITEKGIESIEFLKIDTEGHELNVLKGFEDKLNIVRTIQFEYGGTYLDSKIKLVEVVDYLKTYGFENFAYLTDQGVMPLTDYTDHYSYSNIVCVKSS